MAFIFEVDHLNLEDQSSLSAVFNGDVVIAVNEVVGAGFFDLPFISQNRAGIILFVMQDFLDCFWGEESLDFGFFAAVFILVEGFWLAFAAFATFRFSK